MATTSTRRRNRQPAPVRHGAGSDQAIQLVRGYVRQQHRLRDRSDEVAAMLRKVQRPERRRLI